VKNENLKQGISELVLAFSKPIDFAMARTYWDDIPANLFLAAVRSICSQRTEMFPGSNIYALVRKEALIGIASRDISPQEAWANLSGHLRKTTPVLSSQMGDLRVPLGSLDDITRETVRLVGYEQIAYDSSVFVKKEFLEVYQTLKQRIEQAIISRKALPGWAQPTPMGPPLASSGGLSLDPPQKGVKRR